MDVWNKCRRWHEEGLDCIVATVTEGTSGAPGKSGFKMVFNSCGGQYGSVGGGAVELQTAEAAKSALTEGRNRILKLKLREIGMTCGGDMTLFLEFVPAGKRFIIFGAGHLGRALTPLLESLGYSVLLFDDRPENTSFADGAGGREVIIGDYSDISALEDEIIRSGLVFVATHGHTHDEILLKKLFALDCGFSYLGMIGSRTKIAVMLKNIEAEGLVPPENFFAPVGLAIGGDSAAEIALGIAAEVLAVKNGKDAVHMNKQ